MEIYNGYYTVGTIKKKSVFGTRKRKKSGELLKRKTYIMLEMCIEYFKKKGKEVEDG